MSTDDMYFQKYLKYKAKYIELKNNIGGAKGDYSSEIGLIVKVFDRADYPFCFI